MKIIMLAMLLAVMQASPPIPRQASDNPTSGGRTVKENGGKQDGQPHNFSPVHNQNQPVSAQGNTEKHGCDNADHTVGISKLPPVSVTRNWADWGYWLFSLFLVAVGAAQAGLLYKTLKAIQRQAETMEKQTGILEKSVKAAEESAAAAKNTIEVLKAKERGRIIIRVENISFPETAIVHVVNYTVALYGPNDMVVVDSRAEVESSRNDEFESSIVPTRMVGLPDVIEVNNPKHRLGAIANRERNRRFDPPEVEEILSGTLKLRFTGFILYEDIFGDRKRIDFDHR